MQLWKYDSKLLPIIFNLYVLTKSFCGLKRYKKKEKKYMFVALYLFFFLFVCLFGFFFYREFCLILRFVGQNSEPAVCYRARLSEFI